MEETKEIKETEVIETEASNETVTNEVKAEEPKLTPEEQEKKDLHTQRMGKFKVGMGAEDAKYFRNLLDKSEYKGPQQAYLLAIAKAEMSSVLEGFKSLDKASQNNRFEIELTSATIESLGYFMNNYTGKGADSATRLFTASMLLRPVMGQINALDEKIQTLNNKKDIADAKKQ